MSCQNCYNGCADIISDKCTKYTGNNVPELGIENGDSLFSVQQSIFSFLLFRLNTCIIAIFTHSIC